MSKTSPGLAAWNPVTLTPVYSAWRMFLTVMLTTSMLGGTILAVRLVEIDGVGVTAGALLFPFTYSILVLVAEVYGLRASWRLAWFGIMSLTLLGVIFEIVDNLPATSGADVNAMAFHALYGAPLGVVFIVIVGFTAGEVLGLLVLGAAATVAHGGFLWVRVFLSPLVAQATTSLVVLPLIFLHAMGPEDLVALVAGRLLFAVGFAVTTAPLLYMAVIALRRHERPNILRGFVRDLRQAEDAIVDAAEMAAELRKARGA